MEAFTTVVVLEGDSRLVRHSRGALFLTDMALIVVVSIFRGDFIVDVVVSVQNTNDASEEEIGTTMTSYPGITYHNW